MYPNITDETLREFITAIEGMDWELEDHNYEMFRTILSALDTAYGEIAQLREENEKLESAAYETASETLDGVIRYEPARNVMRLLNRCEYCRNKLENSNCPICALDEEDT